MLKPRRELQVLEEKLHSMSVGMERIRQEQEEGRQMEWNGIVNQSGIIPRDMQGKEDEEECERMKRETNMACQSIAERYDALVKFTSTCPCGSYEQFIEYLLMGGGDDYYNLICENFYDECSEYRKLWNDNLTLGLPVSASTLVRREYVPVSRAKSPTFIGGIDAIYPWHSLSTDGARNSDEQRHISLSEDDSLANLGQIMQGLGSAVNVITNASSFVWNPLKDIQVSGKRNALDIETDYEEALEEDEDTLDVDELMRLKQEAEETCLNATIEHLLAFVKGNPTAKYHQWIEDLHPENAHDGTLLEGLDKIIDHRFFVKTSDHRRIWNENLFTFLDPSTTQGRDYVPARARRIDDFGGMVVAADILSGSAAGGVEITARSVGGKSEDISSDLIQFG
ncbi:hypothetical protein ACHAW5_001484 [Stephanodiscus triporus]|uniref:Uncharacterized protein n=1 Tax=Stephanodiscus triporus TaxID=2934178 RepID=A0ABD3Q2G9_9STRA